jgi:hypothetical protein
MRSVPREEDLVCELEEKPLKSGSPRDLDTASSPHTLEIVVHWTRCCAINGGEGGGKGGGGEVDRETSRRREEGRRAQGFDEDSPSATRTPPFGEDSSLTERRAFLASHSHVESGIP